MKESLRAIRKDIIKRRMERVNASRKSNVKIVNAFSQSIKTETEESKNKGVV